MRTCRVDDTVPRPIVGADGKSAAEFAFDGQSRTRPGFREVRV
jgi:hypothetical protein